MDIPEYFMQKEHEFEKYGVVPENPDNFFHLEEGSNDQRGYMRGHLRLTEGAVLSVYERIAVRGKGVTREAYCYTLVIDGIHVHRWERDPRNHPEDPVHEHVGTDEKRRRKTNPMPMAEAILRGWDEVSLQAEAPLE